MERLWKNEGAMGRKRFDHFKPRSGLNKPNLFATGCHRLPPKSHGKEGVDGLSPSEGSAKAPEIGAFSFSSSCSVERAVGMEPFIELSRRRSLRDGLAGRSRSVTRPTTQTLLGEVPRVAHMTGGAVDAATRTPIPQETHGARPGTGETRSPLNP